MSAESRKYPPGALSGFPGNRLFRPFALLVSCPELVIRFGLIRLVVSVLSSEVPLNEC